MTEFTALAFHSQQVSMQFKCSTFGLFCLFYFGCWIILWKRLVYGYLEAKKFHCWSTTNNKQDFLAKNSYFKLFMFPALSNALLAQAS